MFDAPSIGDNHFGQKRYILNYIKKTGDNFLYGSDFYGIKFTDLLFNLVQKIGEINFISQTFPMHIFNQCLVDIFSTKSQNTHLKNMTLRIVAAVVRLLCRRIQEEARQPLRPR